MNCKMCNQQVNKWNSEGHNYTSHSFKSTDNDAVVFTEYKSQITPGETKSAEGPINTEVMTCLRESQ